MTEPNDPATPLSRMRFSWQRGTAPPQDPTEAGLEEAEPATAPPGRVDDSSATDERWSPPYDMSAAAPTYAPPPEAPPSPAPLESPPIPPPATRLGRAADAPVPLAAPGPVDPVDDIALDDAFDSGRTARRDTERDARRRTTKVARNRAEPTRTEPAASGRTGKPTSGRRRPRDGFEVPKPGGRFTGGRGGHVAVRVTLVLTSCLVVLGLVGYTAYGFGIASMRNTTYTLGQDEIDRYGLTEYPLEQAGRFAADYVRLCLTYSSEPGVSGERQTSLARFTADGVDSTCVPKGEGAQEVVDSNWTGGSEPIDGIGEPGHTRMMTVRVLAGEVSRVVTVPVYVADLRSGDGMRIVGELGEMPQPLLVDPDPEQMQARGEVDGRLTEGLTTGEFFQQYFEAWGESDGAALGRFTTPDAMNRADAGLNGVLVDPEVTSAEVFLPEGAESGHTWSVGDTAEAWVRVTWRNPEAGEAVTEDRAYRLRLVLTNESGEPAQSWAVDDIRGGVPSAGS